ncbi:MAG TPA: YraN family protein [Xanthomonadaceae bacterium]|nr:YraN family protein [Xanthomonadaceae bacterium]
MDRRALGDGGERLAQAFLQGQGLQTIARNVRFRFGEIDLVMREGEALVFVEVRLRGSGARVDAATSVDRGKQRRLARAASAWLAARPAMSTRPCRFDVVALDGSDAEPQWIRDAFRLDDLA